MSPAFSKTAFVAATAASFAADALKLTTTSKSGFKREQWDAEKAKQIVLGYNETTGAYQVPPPTSMAMAEEYCETFWEECEHTEAPFVGDRHVSAGVALQCPRISALITEGLFEPSMVSEEHGMSAEYDRTRCYPLTTWSHHTEEYKWGCSSVIFTWQEPPQPRSPTANCMAWWSMCHSMGPEYDPAIGEFVSHDTAVTKCTRVMDLISAGHLATEQIPPQLTREDYLNGCEMYEQTVIQLEEQRKMDGTAHMDSMTEGEQIPDDPVDDCYRFWEDCWFAASNGAVTAPNTEPVIAGHMIATSPSCMAVQHTMSLHMQDALNVTAGVSRSEYIHQCETEIGLNTHVYNDTEQDACYTCHQGCYALAYPMLAQAEASRECTMCNACHDGCESILGYDDMSCHQMCSADKKEGFDGCGACDAKKQHLSPEADMCMMRCDANACGGHVAPPHADECAECHAHCNDADCSYHCDMVCGHEHNIEPHHPVEHAAGATDGHLIPLGVNGSSVHDTAMQAGLHTPEQMAAAGVHLSDGEEAGMMGAGGAGAPAAANGPLPGLDATGPINPPPLTFLRHLVR
eukprot:g11792.t1